MAPSAVYSQAQAAAIKAGKKRKREEAKPVVAEEVEDEEEVVSLDGEEDEDEEDSEEDEDEDEDVEDDENDEEGADTTAMSVFSDLDPKFSSKSNGKGKQRALPEVSKENGKVFKQKTLILCSRGITHRMRHMMKDLGALLPHSKTDSKLDTKHQLSLLNELADLSNCSSALFFEARRHADLYMWCSLTPNGPSVRFHLLNAHTMDELKMTGNCLKGSRPIVVFDKSFDETGHFRLMKEVLMQVFAVPKTARRAKPFVDHVTSFSVSDGKIWFRNYQIIHDAPLDLSRASAAADETPEEIARKAMKLSKNAEDNMSMNEIGPRFVLTPVKIFEGSFGGAVVWENKDWVTPQAKLQNAKLAKAIEYKSRKGQEVERKGRKEFLETQELAEREASGRAALDKRRVFA